MTINTIIPDVALLALLALATEAVTEIVVDSRITDPIRNWVKQRAFPQVPEGWVGDNPPLGAGLWRFLSALLDCGYCTSVWVAGWWAVFTPLLVSWPDCPLASWMVSWVVALFVLHRLSNWLHVLFSLVKKGRVRTYDVELKLSPVQLINSQIGSQAVEMGVDDGISGARVDQASSETGPQASLEAGGSSVAPGHPPVSN